jgi:DNA repair photolyase
VIWLPGHPEERSERAFATLGLVRWRTEGDDAQGALFPDAERHVGRGEFRGMEFLHVKARSIINTLPAGSHLPFRHTINAYRGCSHACSYCFARPTHDYLGLDIGEGFERQIVVKVNAVERLRAELDPRKWCGEPIAMGTNTDPYQRAEGKYHLTRGLVEELGRARNPFSILTKSTLVLRDADVLAEAAERTDVTVSFSVGTVDEEVWRATEPGTPPPWKRLEALAQLKDKGLRCGVLVAPVLPGLSDTAESLEAVVKEATAAGADSVSGGMVVYLKPGVREVFLGHLAETHPHLVPRYEAMFRGVNAPSSERRRVADLLAEARARHRPRAVAPPRPAPHRNPAPPARKPSPPAGEQLGLGV